jgi:hypothetical protein
MTTGRHEAAHPHDCPDCRRLEERAKRTKGNWHTHRARKKDAWLRLVAPHARASLRALMPRLRPEGEADRLLSHVEEAPDDGSVAHADDERISEHLDRLHGGEHNVFHEIVSERVHVDVHVLSPTTKHPFWLLATAGMSARPMNVPHDLESPERWRYAELCMLLPPSWSPSQEAFRDERVFWPVRVLKSLARLPHDYSTWLGWGHSIPNDGPFARGTKLTGAVVIPPYLLGDAFFEVPGTPTLHMFQVLPITSAEMRLKLAVGLCGLLDTLEARLRDPYGPVDPLRRSAV